MAYSAFFTHHCKLQFEPTAAQLYRDYRRRSIQMSYEGMGPCLKQPAGGSGWG